MRLDQTTWREVETYLDRLQGIILPAGSTEQHGPIGLIGTDAICAEEIAIAAAKPIDALVAPTLSYAPAPFNTAFPGTISVSVEVFQKLIVEILSCLQAQGFQRIYVLNGHGANVEPLRDAADRFSMGTIQIKSWWDFEPVNALRRDFFGDWEGMHATPSEVAITQATTRIVCSADAESPPRALSGDYIAEHAGDRHAPPNEHRQGFPDGRVGSHSALATPEKGAKLLHSAAQEVRQDFLEFCR